MVSPFERALATSSRCATGSLTNFFFARLVERKPLFPALLQVVRNDGFHHLVAVRRVMVFVAFSLAAGPGLGDPGAPRAFPSIVSSRVVGLGW